jgi:hypothetical protein
MIDQKILLSAVEIIWVTAVFCIFSRQIGIWRRRQLKQLNNKHNNHYDNSL